MNTKTLMKRLQAVVLSTRTQIHNESLARRASIAQGYEERNGGEYPTVDSLGNLHAPCDGYADENDNLYGKGQFVPQPERSEDHFYLGTAVPEPKHTSRVCVQGDLVTSFKEAVSSVEWDNDLHLSLGSTWELNGKPTAYLYVKSYFKRIVSAALVEINEHILPEKEKAKAMEIAQRGDAVTGRLKIKAKVIATPMYESRYARDSYEHKLLVELPNKSVAFGTLPKSLYAAKAGDVVEFTATFNPKAGEHGYSYFSRPTKASIVEIFVPETN